MHTEYTPAELAGMEKFNQDVTPAILPVLPGTWLSESGMGIDLDAGSLEFVDDGSHVWESFFRHWGWWKTIALGWYSYTDLRDFHSHNKQGIGRPWLRSLPEYWQELIFRELVLMVKEWNSLVDVEYSINFERDEEYPRWLERWLSLTNQSWRQGVHELDEELHRCASENLDESSVAKMTKMYTASAYTWRPMMPERAVHHQKYGDRGEHWTFERA